jgi:hypothetical protein
LTKGDAAEQLVFQRLRSALPPDYRLYPNVAWLGRTADHRGLRDGEADIVLAHPDRGFLVFETKAGEIARDAHGRWWAGKQRLEPSPFEQARTNLHALMHKLEELPDAPAGFRPIAGHAVALPDVDLESVGAGLRLLGPEIEPDLLFDRAKLPADDPATTCRAVEHALDLWAGRSTDKRPPGEEGLRLLDEILATSVALRSLLRSEIEEGERQVVELTKAQYSVLNVLNGQRRAEIVGGAGTGKTMLAAEKARRLAKQGFRTLLVCFNQPLARLLRDETADVAEATGYLEVRTFHQLCEDLGVEAGVLPERPDPPPQEWWDRTLPRALDEAIEELGPRYHAVVVDEGQDFDGDWLLSLESLLFEKDDVFYVFHDPAQALYREDVVGSLELPSFPLEMNCRNPGPIHRLAMSHAADAPETVPMREEGREPELISAAPGAETVGAVRRVLHRLRVDEKVPPWEIAVLTGASLEDSAVWRQRTFGNEVLWNGQVDDAGRSNRLAAHLVPGTGSRSRSGSAAGPPAETSRPAICRRAGGHPAPAPRSSPGSERDTASEAPPPVAARTPRPSVRPTPQTAHRVPPTTARRAGATRAGQGRPNAPLTLPGRTAASWPTSRVMALTGACSAGLSLRSRRGRGGRRDAAVVRGEEVSPAIPAASASEPCFFLRGLRRHGG